MADWASLVVPAVSALLGVGLTLVHTTRREAARLDYERRGTRDARALNAVAELAAAITDLGRVLRTAGEDLVLGPDDAVRRRVALVQRVDELVGAVRRNTAFVRLVGPRDLFDLLVEIESALVPLHEAALHHDGGEDNLRDLVKPSIGLLRLRDAVIAVVRRDQGFE